MSDYMDDSGLGALIWEVNHRDEANLSALGASIIAKAVLNSKWLAEHERGVAAGALHDVAEYLDSFEGPGGRSSLHDKVGRDLIRMIRERADQIEANK
jgi:hypothetical protein